MSVGKQFQIALNELVAAITATDVHYIRCLKSNIEQDPMRFDASYVEAQMNQAGLPAAGEILVAGYPHKFSHYDFYLATRHLVTGLLCNTTNAGGTSFLCVRLFFVTILHK